MPSAPQVFEWNEVHEAISRGIYGLSPTWPDKIYDEIAKGQLLAHADAAATITEVKQAIKYAISDFYEKATHSKTGAGSIVKIIYDAIKRLGVLKAGL